MLSLKELSQLLRLNKALLALELNKDLVNFKRVLELQYHRSVLKDCIIDQLLNKGA